MTCCAPPWAKSPTPPEGMSDESQARLAEAGVGPEAMDDLFVRHTYLGAIIGMVVQASFGIDIRRLAETDPADLLQGRELHNATGLQGVLEADFFAWPSEVGGNPLLQTLARRVARFDWADAPRDTAATLYETVIPPEERRQLGEYYTPTWLARAMIEEMVDDPLNQRVLDPACGSGTFVAEAVAHFIAAAREANWAPWKTLNRLRGAVTGIDVHPVAVHLARAAWTLAARPAIHAATAGPASTHPCPFPSTWAMRCSYRYAPRICSPRPRSPSRRWTRRTPSWSSPSASSSGPRTSTP